MHDTNETYGSEGEFIKKVEGDDERMFLTNGKSGWQFAKDIVQFIVIPLIVVVYFSIDSGLKENNRTLVAMKDAQVAMASTMQTMKVEQQLLKEQHGKDAEIRAQFHHTANRSCLDCKMPFSSPKTDNRPYMNPTK